MKKRRFPISARMALSFGMILVIICIICAVFLMQLTRLTRSIEDIYIHPFTISNTIRGINSAILEIHGAMKDIVLSRTESEIRAFAAQVDTLEKAVLDDFTIVYGRYLGDMTDVDDAYNVFIGWRVIRDEVIELAHAGNRAEASAIMRGKGARYVRLMDQRIRGLISFAENKAISFFGQADGTTNRPPLCGLLFPECYHP